MSKCGNRYNECDLENNFNALKIKYKQVPLFNEFKLDTNISINTYTHRLNLKGKVYDEIVRHYVTQEEYDAYIQRKRLHKTSVGKLTGSMSKIYSDDMFETNLRYIFDLYMSKYTKYPSRRLFDSISPIDSSQYRKRYNKSWTEICNTYGYDIKDRNIEETICLNMCAEIFNSKYKSQQTWDWLIGVGGKNMFCDGYFDDLGLNIEFDGSSHRIAISKFGGKEKLIRTKENDKLKDELLGQHGIKAIRIDSRLKWYKKEELIKIIISECESRGYNYHDFFILSNDIKQSEIKENVN